MHSVNGFNWICNMSRGGKRPGAGRKVSAPTKLKTFRIPADKYEEIVDRIKALISFYNNA